MDVVEIHPWGATVDDIECPDQLVFDLHPGSGVEWSQVTESALQLREVLRADGLDSWPKLGGEGDLHVMVPFDRSLEWDAARGYCKLLAQELAAKAPASYTTQPGATNRTGKIYIDSLRNGRGSTAIGAYSPIAQQGFPVAVPLTWEQVEKVVRPETFTMAHPDGGFSE
jgi:bifunctional non-homologous end joining protein LigD